MDLELTGEVWFWRGPAPHHFLSVPLRADVRRREQVELGDTVTVGLTIDV